jgi:hypothetical protein
MKGKITTIRKIISDFQTTKIELGKGIPANWKELSYGELVCKHTKKADRSIEFATNESKDKLFVNYVYTELTRVGNKVFSKRYAYNILYMQNNSLKIKDLEFFKTYCSSILEVFGITWTKDLNSNIRAFLHRGAILKSVITGRVYNEETLIKKIASTCFGVKNIEWREMKKFLINNPGSNAYFSIIDLDIFTKNLNNSIRVINRLREENNLDLLALIQDTLNNAICLNKKIDLNWSVKRLQEEHQVMIQKICMFDIDKKSDEPLYDEPINDDNIQMLNSEKELFVEGMTMSHCVYVNYYKSVDRGNYQVYHMSTPENCTIGVRIDNDGNPSLDQAYRFKNRPIKDLTRMVIQGFLEKNFQRMKDLALKRKLVEKPKKDDNCPTYDDLPF